jgi:outer membrane protein assembly factor BamB
MAYDPLSGRELWRVQYPGGYSTASRPVMVGGLVLVNSGFERPKVMAVRPDGKGDVTATHVAWSLDRGVANKPSPAVVDGLVYFLHDSGTLACRDGKTGQAVWQDRLAGSFSASPIAGAGRIYFFDDRGQTTVIAPGSSEMKVLATNKLDAGCMASPAVSGNAMFVRTKTHLYRIEARGS